jgi:hypothetical protein
MKAKKALRTGYLNLIWMTLIFVLLIWLVALPPSAARASISGEARGTDAPEATLGPYTMTPFPEDTRPTIPNPYVTSVESPLGGIVDFSSEVMHFTIPTWPNWSHGYDGGVYWTTTTNVSSVELTLPAQTVAFYFYAQPGPGSGTVNITHKVNVPMNTLSTLRAGLSSPFDYLNEVCSKRIK